MSARTTDLETRFDEFTRATQAALSDRWQLYADMRAESPVFRQGPITVVTKYRDVGKVLLDPVNFSSGPSSRGVAPERVESFSESERQAFLRIAEYEGRWMAMINGERHERVRALGARVFSPRAVQGMQEQIEQTIARMVDEVAGPKVDFIDDFAFRLPLQVISDVMDIPEDMRLPLHEAWVGLLPSRAGSAWRTQLPAGLREVDESFVRLHEGMRELLRLRRGKPTTVIMNNLCEALEEERVEEADVLAVMVNFFTAGHQTTQDLLGNGVVAFSENPDQWQRLADDQTLAMSTVEEILRFRSPVQEIERIVETDTVVGDEELKAGTHLMVSLGAANTDDEVFDSPLEFRIDRADAGKHVAFGRGVHFCLGAALSRMEAASTFKYLVRHYPQFAVTATPQFVESTRMCGFAEIEVDFGKRADV